MENIRVSPRHLGKIKLPDFCELCYVASIAIGFKPPFEFHAGLLNSMDSFEKRLVDAHYAANGELPKWLDPLGCVEPVSFPHKMTKDFDKYALTLVGKLDALFRKTDGTLCVVDYKTAKHKKSGDPLLPLYEVQLLGYAELVEHCGLGEVSSSALVYFENRLSDYKESPLDLLEGDGFQVSFSVAIHEVELPRKTFAPLLAEFRRYADMTTAPAGREDCENCEIIQRLISSVQTMERNEKGIKDLVQRDVSLARHWLQIWRGDHRRFIADGFRRWEADLDELGDVEREFVPASWDL